MWQALLVCSGHPDSATSQPITTKTKPAHNNQPILSKKMAYENASPPTKEGGRGSPSSIVHGPSKKMQVPNHQGTLQGGESPAQPINNKIK